MFCLKCGAPIREGNSFCEQCGAPVNRPAPAVWEEPPAAAEELPPFQEAAPAFAKESPAFANPPQPAAKKRKTAIIAVVAAAVVCIGCICGVLLTGNGPAYTKKLETARQYVNEENYDQAEETYLALIADKPKKEAAYLELSDLYLTQNRYEESVAILHKGKEVTGKASSFDPSLKKANEKFSGVWKTAYRKLLTKNSGLIESYEYPQYSDPSGATALCDINGDDVPELFFFESLTEYGGGTLYVYSYRNGKAVPLDVRFPQMNLSSSTEMEDHFMDVAAASGTTYAIYKSSEKNRFIICATISDEDSQLVTCEYTVDGDLKVSEEYWGDYGNLQFNDSGSEVLGMDHEYYHVTDTIDQKEFDQQQQRLANSMEEVLITNASDNFDEPVLHKAAGEDSSARFCQDMILDLTVTEADTGDGSGSTGDGTTADYSAVIDEYQSVLQKITSGDYTSGDDISRLGDLRYVPESFVIGASDPTMLEYNTGLRLQYAETDLNGDGIRELITGCISNEMDTPSIDSIYTSSGGAVARVISSDSFMYRSMLQIYADGLIEYSGSSGAAYQSYEFFTLPASGVELKETESFTTEAGDPDSETIVYHHNEETISEKDFYSQLEKRHDKKLLTPDWK
ncbi:MAG: zinc-ribbon domain-containing protein [Firmicutes bacterium]|nr:zinc-ribbon domain-containing protein [Bacillota bacterium]